MMSDIVKDMIIFIENKEREMQVDIQDNNTKTKNSVVNSILEKLDEEFNNEN